MIRIDDLDKLKFTSIRNVIHFKYDNEDYFVCEKGGGGETRVTSIYKGRTKYKNDCIKSVYGFIPSLIKYKYHKNTLSSIDKENFVKKLYKAELIDTSIQYIREQVESENVEVKMLKEQIYKANQRLREINY